MSVDVSKMNRNRLCTVCSVGWARNAGIKKTTASSTATSRRGKKNHTSQLFLFIKFFQRPRLNRFRSARLCCFNLSCNSVNAPPIMRMKFAQLATEPPNPLTMSRSA